jgi:predicted transcriptional regulator
MRLNKKLQYAILLCLYLTRSGKSKIETIALNLNISKQFLDRIANTLKNYGVLQSFKGPGGGFELTKNARMFYIFRAMGEVGFLNAKDSAKYVSGGPEERAFSYWITNLGLSLNPLLNRKVESVMKEIVSSEMARLGQTNLRGWEN